MIDDVITHGTWHHACKKCSLTLIITNLEWLKTREKDVVGIVTFDLIGLLPTNHVIILQWYVGIYEETFDANMKIAQTTQNTIVEILLLERRVCDSSFGHHVGGQEYALHHDGQLYKSHYFVKKSKCHEISPLNVFPLKFWV